MRYQRGKSQYVLAGKPRFLSPRVASVDFKGILRWSVSVAVFGDGECRSQKKQQLKFQSNSFRSTIAYWFYVAFALFLLCVSKLLSVSLRTHKLITLRI